MTAEKQWMTLLLGHRGHASSSVPLSVQANEQKARAVDKGACGPQEPSLLTTFCLDSLKQWDTSGVLGAQTLRMGRWWPGSRAAVINMRKGERRGGGTGTLAPIFAYNGDQRGGDSFAQQSVAPEPN